MSRYRRSWLWVAGAPVRFAELALIRAYRFTLSGVVGGHCRFHPTCSEYAEIAVRELGAVRGSILAAWRVLRCSPLSAGGIDYPKGRGRLYEADIHESHDAARQAGGVGA